MKKIATQPLILVASLTSLACSIIFQGAAMADNIESKLRLLIVHYTDDDFAKFSANSTSSNKTPATVGKNFLDIYPASQIKAVEIQGGEVVIPSALALSLVAHGQFTDGKVLIAVQRAPALAVRLQNGSCILFHLLINPANNHLQCAQSGSDILIIPDDFKSNYSMQNLHVGMTRGELQKHFYIDGGLSVPFRSERMVASDENARKDNLRTKLNVSFKPAGMSDQTFYLAKWQTPKPSDSDIVMQMSPLYLEQPFFN